MDRLAVENLSVVFDTASGELPALQGVSFTLGRGEVLGLVGESGCGKTLTALAILRLLPPSARVSGGSVRLDGRDLLSLSASELRSIRGRRVAMIFQEPSSALNPVLKVGTQVAEGLRQHFGCGWTEAWERGTEFLGHLGISDPAARMHAYPHQLSGGMRQRALVAAALACQPDVLIADEPATALDVATQRLLLSQVERLREERGLSVLVISHDLELVAGLAHRVAVMYAGQVVELAPVEAIFTRPSHPYTRKLLEAQPGLFPAGDRLPVLEGAVPRLEDLPPGCRFHPRCPEVETRCRQVSPFLVSLTPDHRVRCLRRPEPERSNFEGGT